MKTFHGIILAGILCVMLIAAGCTSSSPATTTPATTEVATAATTAAPAPSVTEAATAATTAATATTAQKAASWSGTWNSSWLESDGNQTVSVMTITQTNANVSGTYAYSYPNEGNYTGSLKATVVGTSLTGNYFDTDNDTGSIAFVLSDDGNAFTGKWAHATGNQSDLKNSTLFWNGVRQ
jgi:hypothetical protein